MYQQMYGNYELLSFTKQQLANILTARNIDFSYSIATRRNALHALLEEILLKKQDKCESLVCVTCSLQQKKITKGKCKDDDYINKREQEQYY